MKNVEPKGYSSQTGAIPTGLSNFSVISQGGYNYIARPLHKLLGLIN